MQGDDLVRFLRQSRRVAAVNIDARQRPVRFHDIGTQPNRVTPFRFGAIELFSWSNARPSW